jgi:hypothetical protein
MRSWSLVILAACSFASYARRSNVYPGAYDRAIANARTVGDSELVAQIEALGDSSAYDRATHELLWCLDGLASGEVWQRAYQKHDVQIRDVPLHYQGDPESYWSSEMQRCVESCSHVINGSTGTGEASSARDVAVARKYLPRCEASYAQVQGVRTNIADAKSLGRSQSDVANADRSGASGCFLDTRDSLLAAESELAPGTSSPSVAALRAKIADVRARYADGLSRADQYLADPEVRTIDSRLRRLGTDISLVEHHLKDVEQGLWETSAKTRTSAYGGQTEDPGDPQAHDRYQEERELLRRKLSDLEAAKAELTAGYVVIAERYHVACNRNAPR